MSNFYPGKKIAGFTSAEEDVVGLWDALPDVRGLGKSLEQVFIARGAEYTKADPWMPHIEIDGTFAIYTFRYSVRKYTYYLQS